MNDAVLDIDADVDWDRTAFSLICPDAVARHLGLAIVERMREHGFRPLAWTCLWHRPEGLDAYFERNITQAWQGYLYRLADQVFAHGPTIAMLMVDTAPVDGIPSHQRLRAVKGSSEPAKAKPGTIRGDLGSINVSLGLVHSSDSGAESRRETEAFVGRDGFPAGQDPADLNALLHMLQAGRPETRGYDDVLAAVRARIMAVLWPALPTQARRLADKLRAGGTTALAAPGAGAQLADLLPMAGHPLEPVLRCEFLPNHPTVDLDRAQAMLTAHGTPLDPWERLVLATSTRFDPRRGP